MTIYVYQLSIIVAYLAVVTIISAIIGKRRATSADEYMVAGRKLNFIQVFSAVYAGLGIGSTVGLAETAFTTGISAAWWEIAGDVTLMLGAVFLVRYFRTYLRYSPFELLETGYNSKTRTFGSFTFMVGQFTISLAQLIGGAAILSATLGLPMFWALILTAIISLSYTISGGMWSLSYSNIVHTFLSMVGVVVLLFISLSSLGGWENLTAALPPVYFDWFGMGLSKTWALIIASAIKFFANAALIQIILSAKNSKTAIAGSIAGALCMMLVGVASTLVGLVSRASWPSISPLLSMPYAALQLHPLLGGLILAGIFASLTATTSRGWLTMVTLYVADIYRKFINRAATQHRTLSVIRLATLIVAVATTFIAFFNPQEILYLHVTGQAIRQTLFFVFIFAMLKTKRIRPIAGLAALVGGLTLTTIWILLDEPFGIDRVYIALSATLVILLTTHLLSSKFGKRAIGCL